MKNSPRFVFSPRSDAWVWLTPLLVAPLLGLLSPMIEWISRKTGLALTLRPAIYLDWAYLVFLDSPHSFASLYGSYWDPQEWKARRTLYLLLPLSLVLALTIGVRHSLPLTLRIIAYLNLFHFIRQQYGWMKLSQRRDPLPDKEVRIHHRIEIASIYGATLAPTLWWHGRPSAGGWLYEGDLVFGVIPHQVGSIAMTIQGLLAAALVASLCFRWKRYRRWEWSPFLIWLSTTIAWTGGIVLDWGLEKTLMLDVLHVGVYLYFVYQFGKARWRGKADKIQAAPFYRATPWLFYFPLLGLALLCWGFSKEVTEILTLPPLLLALVLTPPTLHYLLDTWIWKKSASSSLSISTMGQS
jgi:hypothetical protein